MVLNRNKAVQGQTSSGPVRGEWTVGMWTFTFVSFGGIYIIFYSMSTVNISIHMLYCIAICFSEGRTFVFLKNVI